MAASKGGFSESLNIIAANVTTNLSGFTNYSNEGAATTTIYKICPFNIQGTSSQIVVLVVNILHLMVLVQLRRREPSVPLNILITMCVNDISLGIFNAVRFLCLHQPIFQDDCLVLSLAEGGLNMAVARYYIIAAATYDRFVALCRPFEYTSNHILQNITLYLALLFMTTTLVGVTLKIMSERCWYFATLSTGSAAVANSVLRVLHGTILLIITIVTVFSSASVLRELHLLRKSRGSHPAPNNAVLGLTYLILVTLLVFVICLFPSAFVYFAVRYLTLYETQIVSRVAFDTYAIANAVVNGVLYKAYRRQIVENFKVVFCITRKQRIHSAAEQS